MKVRIVSDDVLHGAPEFYAILAEMAELHSRKNADYSPAGSPLANFFECEKLGVEADLGVLVRLSDKWCRIQNLTRKGGEALNESLEDSLLDSAVYYVLCLVLKRMKSRGQQLTLPFEGETV